MSQTKTGRKQKHHIDSMTGEPVVGLTRRPDGRWRTIGTHQTFREPDEQKAIARFRQSLDTPEAKATRINDLQRLEWLGEQSSVSNGDFWMFVASEIRARPKFVAEQTGIEQIGYLTDLQPHEPLPSPDELAKCWMDHSEVTSREKRQVLAAWADFRESTGITGLREITPAKVIEFRDEVFKRGISGKTQQHLFNRTRRIFTFAASRAIAVKACNDALVSLKLLTPKDSTVNLDPQPVSPEDFTLLLKKAVGDDRALLLLCLNCALYLQEAMHLEWDDIRDGCLVTNRKKTGKCLRVSVLWQETLEALSKMERKGTNIFYSYQGAPLTVSGAGKRFRALRKAAGVSIEVKANNLRDGAYTAAVAANVNEDLCRLLVGHRTAGLKDHYCKRNPQMVAPACEAIYRHYFG